MSQSRRRLLQLNVLNFSVLITDSDVSETLTGCLCRQLNIVGLRRRGLRSDEWLGLHCFVSSFSGLHKPAWNIQWGRRVGSRQIKLQEKGRELQSFVQLTEITGSRVKLFPHIEFITEWRLAWPGLECCLTVSPPPRGDSLDYPKNLVPSSQPARSTCPNTNTRLSQDKLSSRWIFYQNKPTCAAANNGNPV